ncbi:MAG: hypothetical protein HQM02_10225, partial [Magnetococcales bacterium]|nr:hypothetical protein [Magnetococcales bacterium]
EGGSGRGERGEAGPLLQAVARTLLGWRPGGDFGPMKMAAAPGPVHSPGFALFPLRFVTRMMVQGS